MKDETKSSIVAGLIVVVILAAVIGCAALYGEFAYGDWKCGIPGVECRRITD